MALPRPDRNLSFNKRTPSEARCYLAYYYQYYYAPKGREMVPDPDPARAAIWIEGLSHFRPDDNPSLLNKPKRLKTVGREG